MQTKPILEFDNVKFAYDKTLPEIVHGVSFALAPNSFTVIVGPSGSGKSTILRLAIGLDKPSKGTVVLSARTRMIFQSGALLPWLSAVENVEIGFTGTTVARARQRSRALDALRTLGIDHLASAYPRNLSGGQRQRVGIARALVSDPELLLLDEPFSALDIDTSEKLSEELLDIHAKAGKTMFMVSHSIEDAVILADTIFVFKDGKITDTVPVNLPRPRRRTDQDVLALVEKVKKMLPGE